MTIRMAAAVAAASLAMSIPAEARSDAGQTASPSSTDGVSLTFGPEVDILANGSGYGRHAQLYPTVAKRF